MKDNCILTAESVTGGHPDKLCDAIADSVLDVCLKHDPAARVACEVMATAGKIIVAGEITARELPDIPAIVCQTVREAGYGGSDYEVEVITHDQSGDIAGAVAQDAQMGAGDQVYRQPRLRHRQGRAGGGGHRYPPYREMPGSCAGTGRPGRVRPDPLWDDLRPGAGPAHLRPVLQLWPFHSPGRPLGADRPGGHAGGNRRG